MKMIKWIRNLFSFKKRRFNNTYAIATELFDKKNGNYVIVTDWAFDKKTGEFYPVEHSVKIP